MGLGTVKILQSEVVVRRRRYTARVIGRRRMSRELYLIFWGGLMTAATTCWNSLAGLCFEALSTLLQIQSAAALLKYPHRIQHSNLSKCDKATYTSERYIPDLPQTQTHHANDRSMVQFPHLACRLHSPQARPAKHVPVGPNWLTAQNSHIARLSPPFCP
ncbi:hypothetical protein K402DRAFT_189063 [Aulographum hederae CBS 113979]|uniref:Uncharacterized protein n=1 Tax=Aulographum hederae CBS 113979 TaxID=1176131 RepID=A0A6G1GPP7_9PEZI|nr:hypothetical protein K402DRAFT_189063 [Aulographum hederae CBS 113979]